MKDLVPGAKLGPYEIRELVGRGGMGAVYKGFDSTLNRHVALKVLLGVYADDAAFAEQFRREARIWGSLDHASIVPVYFADIEGENAYIAMKFLPGGSLADELKNGPIAVERATALLADVAAALDYAHSLGIVHRDVKPANVLIGEEGRGYLSDFGIARVVAAARVPSQTGVVGTPGYMAPEQARSLTPDPRSDLYSLGCMAYEMLTGAQPFKGQTPVDVLMRHMTETPPPLRTLSPGLAQHMETAILKAMSKDPVDRWPTAAIFVQALLGRFDPEKVQTISLYGGTPLPGTVAARPKGRVRRRVAAVVLAVAGLGVGAALLNLLRSSGEPPLAAAPHADGSSAALVSAALRAMDEGAYAEALQMADLALKIAPASPEARAVRERAAHAWEAEKSLGLWSPPPPAVDARPSGG